MRCYAAQARPPPPPQGAKNPKDAAASTSAPSGETAAPKEDPLQEPLKTDEAPLSSLPSLDFAPGEEPHRERTGAKSSKDSLSSIERRRRFWSRVSSGILVLGAAAAAWHSGREWDEDELREMRMVRGT